MWSLFRKPCSRRESDVTHLPVQPSRSQMSHSGLRPRVVRAVLAFVLLYTTWVWAGLRPSFHGVAVVAAGVLLAVVWIGGRSAGQRPLWRDPVFGLGLFFLGFSALQWVNAGREQYFDVGYQRWSYTHPRWLGWPSAFSRADARQMLAWFFPAWTIALAIRSKWMSRHELRGLLLLLACNAGLLSIFGLIQYATGTHAIYWLQPLSGHFFASFAYGNHAAPYFVLTGALTAGLLYRELFDARRGHGDSPAAFRIRHPRRVAILVPVLGLCLVGANLGFSRSGVILTWALAAFMAGYGLFRGWRGLRPAARLNFTASVLGVTGLLYFAVAGLGEKGIQKEFTLRPMTAEVQPSLWERVDLELGGRPQFAKAALQIWLDHPWVGVGGWGFKYLVAEQVPENLWKSLEEKGWANVHFDFLQFLVEFGIVGFGLLLGVLGVMVRELRQRPCPQEALRLMGLAGLGLVVIFSVIDLPFRCPAILYTWVAILAALPRMCEARPPGELPRGGGRNGQRGGNRMARGADSEWDPWTERTGL